jgi:hypothetical protein
MKKTLLGLLCLAFAATAFAQAPARLRGTIASLNGDVLMLKLRDGRDAQVTLTPDASVATAQPAKLEDLKGKSVGVTSVMRNGKPTAVEVHVLPPTAGQGHTPWDLEPNSSMTNANLEGIAATAGGNEIHMKYKDGEQRIIVPPTAAIVQFAPGTRADLKPGEYVFIVAKPEGGEGKYVAPRVSVSKNGVKPPQ